MSPPGERAAEAGGATWHPPCPPPGDTPFLPPPPARPERRLPGMSATSVSTMTLPLLGAALAPANFSSKESRELGSKVLGTLPDPRCALRRRRSESVITSGVCAPRPGRRGGSARLGRVAKGGEGSRMVGALLCVAGLRGPRASTLFPTLSRQ